MTQSPGFSPLVCVVDFHHARGPEVARWFGTDGANSAPERNDWTVLPFLALPDGSHALDEEFSYFTLQNAATETTPASSLFGVSCTRQLDAKEIVNKPPDVTRSSVQKAIVAIVDSPYMFSRIQQQLSAVTKAWFAQKDFSDVAVIESFYDSLLSTNKEHIDEHDQYVGLSLRELIHKYRWQTLVLFKCALLQPKMLFFGAHCERLCLLQFTIISLIPNLIRNLRDCADPGMNTYEETLRIPNEVKTSERSSLLKYMGLPLQIFGKGSLFGPYTPLQQLDVLTDKGTSSFIAGSTNTLLLSQKDRYSDVLINLDDKSISMSSPILQKALTLSHADRRWIDFITQSVNDTWNPSNPTMPTNHGYQGSEEFIRMQFEEYLLALLSCSKYHDHLEVMTRFSTASNPAHPTHTTAATPAEHAEAQDPSIDFSSAFLSKWRTTDNYRIFNSYTSKELFDIVEPKHPCAGGLSVEDIQRRVAQQVADLHLEERFAPTRQAINERLEAGQKRMSSALVGLRNEYATRRQAYEERRSAGAAQKEMEKPEGQNGSEDSEKGQAAADRAREIQQAAQQNLQAAGQKAGAYFSSWGSWAAEKKKAYYEQRSSSRAGASEAAASNASEKDTDSGGATGAKVMTVWRMRVEEDEEIKRQNRTGTGSRVKEERRYDPID